MKYALVVTLVILLLLIAACEGSHYYPPSSGNPPPETSYNLSASVSPSGSGSISPSSGTYEAGSAVTVTAQPSSDYVFDHWSGDASGTSPTMTITMDSDKSVTAYFTYSPPPSTPLNVRIDYIGVKDAKGHNDYGEDPSKGEIQLVIVITDGINKSQEYYIPQVTPKGLEGFKEGIEDYSVKEINQKIYHTASAGDYLRLSIMAYDIDSNDNLMTDAAIVRLLSEIAGVPEAGEIMEKLVSSLPEKDNDLLGEYEETWYPDENYGIGQYNASCLDGSANPNFFVWFSIYSDNEPSLIPEPSLLPDVQIQSVNMPSEVKQSNPGWYYFSWYSNTLTIVNNEDIPLEVDWDAYSSAKGATFDSGTVTILANGLKPVTGSYYYDTPLGPLTETYTIYYHHKKLDSQSGTINIVPGPYS